MTRIVKGTFKTSSGRSLNHISTITFLSGVGDILADGRQRILQMNTIVEPVIPPATNVELAQVLEGAKDEFRMVGTKDLWGLPK